MNKIYQYISFLSVAQLFIFLIMPWTSYGQKEVSTLGRNKDIVISYINEVVNNQKINLISDIYSTDYIFHTMDGKDIQPISDSSLYYFLYYLFKAFPDLHYTIDNIIAENDLVSIYLTGHGTHKDEFWGFAASDNKIKFKEIFVFRLYDMKIIEGWGIFDLDGVKTQISKQLTK